ncbi:MAG: thioredoxin [Elusimicrobia bacterium CG_4_10_14_3_um_filter_49_12_50_7]|nr:MAG: thioredoxin [Elusimicrobia bacterium CG03_land_8_20_14_0_80_50_18]PIY18287.1 MAG: thioredoxin [Elusimicrobia bacterium CG_4_10_14_3_um_filter_49_12_50_7]
MVILNDSNFEQEVIKSELPVLVDFYADWCGPCKMIEPAIEELSSEYEGRVKVCRLNVDDAGQTAAKYRVSSIPFIGFFKSGDLADQIIGAVPKGTLKAKMDSLL